MKNGISRGFRRCRRIPDVGTPSDSNADNFDVGGRHCDAGLDGCNHLVSVLGGVVVVIEGVRVGIEDEMIDSGIGAGICAVVVRNREKIVPVDDSTGKIAESGTAAADELEAIGPGSPVEDPIACPQSHVIIVGPGDVGRRYELEDVGSGTSVESVAARPADEGIGSVVAADGIVAVEAVDGVVRRTAEKIVVSIGRDGSTGSAQR